MDEAAPDVVVSTRRVRLGGRTMREHAARGTMVNGVFLVVLSVLGLVKGFVVAGFLTRADYGIWGILVVGLGTLTTLKQIGIGDRFIQQDEDDQEAAFQKAFTLEAIVTAISCVILLAALPLLAVIYGQWKIVAPGAVAVMMLPAGVLQAPLWVYYREMDFVKQRTLQAAEPIVGLIVAVVLAAAGAGYWSLVLSVFAGAWTTAFLAVRASPFKLRWRYDRSAVRSYGAFSWPILVTSVFILLMAQAAILLPNLRLGIAAAGSITLASTITQFTDRVDQIITQTLYPAICAAKDKVDVLAESFVKSNRLALLWAMPFGFAVSLFAGDLVHFLIGNHWIQAIGPLEIFGVTAAVGHIGFNWDAYFRARGDTRPIAVATGISVVVFFAVGVPLLYSHGLVGLSLGLAAHVLALLVVRGYYLARLFHGFAILAHAARAMLPTLPATAAVLIARQLEHGPRTHLQAIAELIGFGLITLAATAVSEGPLVREAIGYMRPKPAPVPVVT